jgi:hypothetical protein
MAPKLFVEQIPLRKLFFIIALFFGSLHVMAQGGTTFPCDPKAPGNGNACPGDCVNPTNAPDPAIVEAGCNCFDGIDNDGDGKIDSLDPNCYPYYGLEFVTPGSGNCNIPPGPGSPFAGIGAPAVSGQNTSDTQSKVAVGDITGDGVPDVIITSKWNRNVRVVATQQLSQTIKPGDIIAEFDTPGDQALFPVSHTRYLFEHEVLIADIDGDGRGEIFTVVSGRGGNNNTPPERFFLMGFRYKPGVNPSQALEPFWKGQLPNNKAAVDLGVNRPGIFGIADFDGDGKAEIYLRNRIYAAESGALLADGGGNWDLDINAAPVAVDISKDDNGRLELVCGHLIYKVPNMAARTLQSLTLWKNMNDPNLPLTFTRTFSNIGTPQPSKRYNYFTKVYLDPVEYGEDSHSSTSVADIDGDGVVDVVFTGAINGPSDTTAVFYWNVAQNKVALYIPQDPVHERGWLWGTGRVNLGRVNVDTRIDLTFIAGNQLFAVSADPDDPTRLVNLWKRTINDSKSGILTVTIYDFDNDGIPELVYRDSQQLVVVDGPTGQNVLFSRVCKSHTYTEGPIIADVNGDGATDICVPCYRNDGGTLAENLQDQSLAEVRLYYSNNNQWVPTRKVWNQPGYFVVNINDNLTLPFPLFAQTTEFEGNCNTNTPGPAYPFNVFLNQVPFLNANGCPTFPAPNLAFSGSPVGTDPNDPEYDPAIIVVPPNCGESNVTVYFKFVNNGDVPLSGEVPVSFFSSDPQLPGSKRLLNTVVSINALQVDEVRLSAPVVINDPTITGTQFELWVVLYADPNAALPLTFGSGASEEECEIGDNYYFTTVTPAPLTGAIEKIQDNLYCSDWATEDGSGILRARLYKPVVDDGDPNTPLPPAEEIGNYTGYSFQWYFGDTATPGNEVPASQGGNTFQISGLKGDGLPDGAPYTLVITENALSGGFCMTPPVTLNILDIQQLPAVTVELISHQTQCDPPNGKLEAIISFGDVAGYTFEWFDVGGQSLSIFGPVADNLVKGEYLVFIYKTDPNDPNVVVCSAPSLPISVEGPIFPEAISSVIKNVEKCFEPNSGIVTAEAWMGGVIDPDQGRFTFDWYFYDLGGVAAPLGSALAPEHGTGATRTGLEKGSYIVQITDNATQCTDIGLEVTIIETFNIPEAEALEHTDQTSCDPAQPNGKIQANVWLGGVGTGQQQDPAAFIFQWFEGQNTLPANLHGTTSDISGRIADNVKGNTMYTVKITHPISDCFGVAEIMVPEVLTYPVITLTPTNNSICDPALAAGGAYNGQVAAVVEFNSETITLPHPDYTLSWFAGTAGTNPPDAPIADANNDGIITGLNEGYYTLVVENTIVHCASQEFEQVEDLPVYPEIVPDLVPSTNCVGGTPNGELHASVDLTVPPDGTGDVTAGYTFQWYSGQFVNPANVLGAAGPDKTGIQGGANYTVEVKNDVSGCVSELPVLLQQIIDTPLATLEVDPNNICDPNLTNPPVPFAGALRVVSIAYRGNTYTNTDLGIFNFAWSTGSTAQYNLTGLDNGTYSVIVSDPALNCIGDEITRDVVNETIPVVVALKDAVASTNCPDGTPNGAVEIDNVDGNPVPDARYRIRWYDGNVVGGTIQSTTPLYSGLQGGTPPDALFTVEVVDQTTGCIDTETQQVPSQFVLPVIAVDVTPNTFCVGADGTVFLTSLTYNTNPVAYPYTGYTFQWTQGGSNLSSSIDPVTGRPAGTYTLTVTNTVLNCTSDPEDAIVVDQLTYPDIVFDPTDQTSCDPAQLNGGLEGMIDTDGNGVGDVTAGYTYQWFILNNGTPANLPGANVDPVNAYRAINLAGNTYYRLRAVNNTSGCEATEETFVREILRIPRIEVVATDIVDCNTPGSVLANIWTDLSDPQDGSEEDDDESNYTFTWYLGVNDSGTLINGVTGNTIGNITVVNSYAATAINNITHCKTDFDTDKVDQPGPLFIVDMDVNFRPASCAEDKGVVTAFVDVGGTPTVAGYSFEWYAGAITNGPQVPPASFYTNPPVSFNGSPLPVDPHNFYGTDGSVDPDIDYPIYPGVPAAPPAYQPPVSQFFGPTLYGYPSGSYTVVVTDNATGCKEFLTDFLPYQEEPIIIVAEITPDDCNGDNGAISVNLQLPAGSDPNDYRVWLIEGANPPLVPPGDPSPFRSVIPNATLSGNVFSGLASGVYTVVAQENDPPYSTRCFSVPVRVDLYQAQPPLLTALSFTANSTCTVAPDPGDGALTIEFALNPDDPNHPDFPPLTPPAQFLLLPQTFTIEVRDENGVLVDNPPVTVPPDVNGVGTLTINNLRNEEYTVTVYSEATQGCPTAKPYTIPWQPSVPEIGDDLIITASEYCDPALEQSARVEIVGVTVAGTPGNLNDYRFDWYLDLELTNPPIFGANGDATATDGGEVLSNSSPGVTVPVSGRAGGATTPPGAYWVKATKIAGNGQGCPSPSFGVIIPDESVNPTVTLTPFADTSCETVDNFEGSLTVEIALASGPGAGGTYTYSWVIDNPNVTIAAATPGNNDGDSDGTDGDEDNPTGLGEGLYTITVMNNITGCVDSQPRSILKSEVPIILVSAIPTDQEICDPTDANILVGDVLVGQMVGAQPHNEFIFNWFLANPNSNKLEDKNNPGNQIEIDLLDNTNYDITTSVGGVTYYVSATRKSGLPLGSGCTSNAEPVTIYDKTVKPIIDFATLSNTACDDEFDGQITVTANTLSGPGAGMNYNIEWLQLPDPSAVVGNALDVASPYTTDYAAGDRVAPGAYSVRVTNVTTLCYREAPVTIENLPMPVEILNVTKIDQLICYPDGSLTVTAVSPANVADYTFEWYKDTYTPGTNLLEDVNNAGTPITGPVLFADYQPATGTYAGNYPVEAGWYHVVGVKIGTGVGTGNGCRTNAFPRHIDLDKNDPRIDFTDVRPNSSCNNEKPNAVITANAREQDGTNTDDYDFVWTYNGDPIDPTLVSGPGASPFNSSVVSSAPEGTYVLNITNLSTTGCEFERTVLIQVDQVISKPTIIEVFKDLPSDCFGGDGLARVERIYVGGLPPTGTEYNNTTSDPLLSDGTAFAFAWFVGNSTTPLLTDPNDPDSQVITHEVTPIPAGTYFVLVEDLATECKSDAVEVVISDDEVEYPVLNLNLTKLQVTCDQVNIQPTGELTATAITNNKPGTDPATYVYTWYNSLDLDVSGTQFDQQTGTPSVVENLTQGNYSVEVYDPFTNCTSFKYYIVPDNSPQFTPQISMGSSPRTLCNAEDGSVLGRVSNFTAFINNPQYPYTTSLNFTGELYVGNLAAQQDANQDGIPDLAGQVMNPVHPVDAPLNFYENALPIPIEQDTYFAVKITDVNTGCMVAGEVLVEDKRQYPEVVAMVEFAVTNCDDTRPNGQLTATADGKVVGFDFEWPDPEVAGNILSTTNKLIAGKPDPIVYTVIATNQASGCQGQDSKSIPFNPKPIPAPSTVVIQHWTSCIAPNGELAANIEGETAGYQFEWFNSTTGITPGSSADFIGDFYFGLDDNGGSWNRTHISPQEIADGSADDKYTFGNDYGVRARELATGCITLVAPVKIYDLRAYPRATFETTPSYCLEPSGTILLSPRDRPPLVVNGERYERLVFLSDIQWYDAANTNLLNTNAIVVGAEVAQVPAGTYRADFVTYEGCIGDDEVVVGTEIREYNLVSVNGDASNEYFHIDCIENFRVVAGANRDNNVKIFNRYGVLVYEADAYDNAEVKFVGIGENGVYSMGNQLPDGTYFFIIDKRDGSRPKTGFLELIR